MKRDLLDMVCVKKEKKENVGINQDKNKNKVK